MAHRRIILSLVVLLAIVAPSAASELLVLTKENWKDAAPAGKEVDANYGDYVLRNEQITCVIARPIKSRNANMTVRGVGGAIIDLGNRKFPNDQLSAFYPGPRGLAFADEDSVRIRVDGQPAELKGGESLKGKSIALWLESSSSPATGLTARVRYVLGEKSNFVTVHTTVRNPTEKEVTVTLADALRADGTFQFGSDEDQNLFWAVDEWFRQCYAVVAPDWRIKHRVSRGRATIEYRTPEGASSTIKPGGELQFTRRLIPAGNLMRARGLAARMGGTEVKPTRLEVVDPNGPVSNARVTVKVGKETIGSARTPRSGRLFFPIAASEFEVEVEAVGRPKLTAKVERGEAQIKLEPCGYLQTKIVDEQGRGLPCKIAIYAKAGGKGVEPNYGPEAAATSVKNLRYTANGRAKCELGPGEYEIVVSRGPEYDAHVEEVTIERNETATLDAVLKRVIDSKGWVSADFHSHSSPSGDNTGSQLGRVQNLIAEHIEFAPCTEHNRISTYMPHLKRLKAERWMATCTGLELTGSPLPLNHQNAFPLKMTAHTQDNGAPQTATNPAVQIERLAMWDDGSEKLVQANHPDLVKMLGDKDGDGKFDGGFKRMFKFMDVVEVHPPAGIFEGQAKKLRRNPIFHWLQMLNLGYRVTGVVNTDAHYNFHGSGWIRNYIQSSEDEPSAIKTMEMVRASEAGKIIMTTGPYLEVTAHSDDKQAGPGGDLTAKGKVRLQVRIQCANWLDINRVQVFVNGRPDPELNFTRRTHPKLFSDDVVKFDRAIEVELEADAHLVVATIGEDIKLGRVAGPRFGGQPPVAVANPIFVDVDGGGFKPNGDLLGLPIPIE